MVAVCTLSVMVWAEEGTPAPYKEAEAGQAWAQYEVGECYYYGKGVSKDYAEAAKWWRLAAEQGDAKAQRSLGWCYDSGEGVSWDMTEAVRWYRKAAEQGDATAQGNLGNCIPLLR